MNDWRIDLIATDGDNVCYGLACDTGSRLVHIHQDADGLWVVRHMVAQQMVLHGSYNEFRAAVAAAELLLAWHPHTEQPPPFANVRLRFGDNGERDAFGFYHSGHGCYYKSLTAMWQRASVHPTHWAEIEETQQ